MTEPPALVNRAVGDVLRLQAEARPDSPYILFRDRSWSFAEVYGQAQALASALEGLGVCRGDRIAIDLPNWPEFVISAFAAAELGAAIVPLNPGYKPRELQFMLRNSEASVVVAAENYQGVDYLELFESMLSELPELQYLVTVGKEDLWYDDRIFQFEDLVSSGMGRERPPLELDPEEELFAILYTPGTMGAAKGVMLSHGNLLLTAGATAESMGLDPQDLTLCTVPLFHIFGLSAALFTALCSGSSVLLQERFDAREALELVERHRATVLHGVPTMFVLLLRELARVEMDLTSLRTGIVAGAPVSEELARRVRSKLVPELEIAYGLTETSPTVSITRASDAADDRTVTVGRPLEGIDVRILTEAGEVAAVGAEGELAVRGYNVMQGYFRQPSETAASFTADGFFRTGDLAVEDERGYLRIVGRKSDVIIRGGYNVHPREVEDHLRAHLAVLDTVVVGVPNEVMGELICACVLLVEGAIITEDELREYCREELAPYKVPDLVRFMDVFPMTPSGEARRVALARLVRAQEASHRESRG